MKFREFKTAKGEFVLMDMKDVDYDILGLNGDRLEKIGFLSDMTEDQAKEVVDSSVHTGLFGYYVKDIPVNTYCYKLALESLNTLLESIGVLFDYVRPHIPDLSEEFSNIQHLEMTLDVIDKMDNSFDKSRTYLFRKV